MYKGIATARIVGINGQNVEAGEEVSLSKEQLSYLNPYLKNVEAIKNQKDKDKSSKTSSKVQNNKKKK